MKFVTFSMSVAWRSFFARASFFIFPAILLLYLYSCHAIGPDLDRQPEPEPWIIDAEQAVELLDEGAILLDARHESLFAAGTLPGARHIAWEDFTEEIPASGALLADEEQLAAKLAEFGIGRDVPVLVFADPAGGWGEEGRIVWMLRNFGHESTFMIDGGYGALHALVDEVEFAALAEKNRSFRELSATEKRELAARWQFDSHFEVFTEEIRENLTATAAEADDAANRIIYVDVRETREFAGQTPYGESRGGHLPGAVHLYYKDFIDANGFLLPEEQIKSILAEKSVQPDRQVVAYCTGGVRSGWFAVVLHDLGYDVSNYAGSMWEWTRLPEEDYPVQ